MYDRFQQDMQKFFPSQSVSVEDAELAYDGGGVNDAIDQKNSNVEILAFIEQTISVLLTSGAFLTETEQIAKSFLIENLQEAMVTRHAMSLWLVGIMPPQFFNEAESFKKTTFSNRIDILEDFSGDKILDMYFSDLPGRVLLNQNELSWWMAFCDIVRREARKAICVAFQIEDYDNGSVHRELPASLKIQAE